ncbi:MAG: hypothetical protein ACE5DN_03990, partial [Flavobacteriales bacterium]
MLLKPAHHRRIFLSGLLITIIGLPTSKFLMSVGQLILLGNWFLEGGLSTKFKTFFANKTAVILASVYLLHLLGLLWTEDFGYAFNDLRIKLPLLWLPLVLSSSPPVSRRQLDKMLWVFIGASLVSSLVSTMIYSGCMQAIGLFKDGRISPFISHIRLSLLMVLAYLVLLRFSFRKTVNIKLKITTFILALWFAVFLFILGAMTGIFIFFLVTFLLLCYFVFSLGVKPIKRLAIASVFLLMCLAMSMYVYRTVSAFLS